MFSTTFSFFIACYASGHSHCLVKTRTTTGVRDRKKRNGWLGNPREPAGLRNLQQWRLVESTAGREAPCVTAGGARGDSRTTAAKDVQDFYGENQKNSGRN